jgi:hypothetical protein
MEPYFKR